MMAESQPSAKEEPLAVFDVDGTLFRRGLLPALTRRLVDEGVFSERVREELSRGRGGGPRPQVAHLYARHDPAAQAGRIPPHSDLRLSPGNPGPLPEASPIRPVLGHGPCPGCPGTLHRGGATGPL